MEVKRDVLEIALQRQTIRLGRGEMKGDLGFTHQLYPLQTVQSSLCPHNRIIQAVTANSPSDTLRWRPISIMLNEF